jgi:urea transporter
VTTDAPLARPHGKPLQIVHARGEALMTKRRIAKLIAKYDRQRQRGLSEFVIVLVGIALLAFLDGMLILLAILVFCAAIFLTVPPHIAAIVVIAAWVVILVAYGRRVMARWGTSRVRLRKRK